MKQPFLLLGLFLTLWACKREADTYQPESSEAYFPLAVGDYWVYQVDSIVYDLTSATPIDTNSFQLREEIVDTLRDESGMLLYRFDRAERSSETEPWLLKDVFFAGRYDQKAVRIENNLKLIPLVFPLRETSRWDPTVFVDPSTVVYVVGESIQMFKDWNARALSYAVPDTLLGQVYDQTATIELANSENLIELRRVTETYAREVGLVFREALILDTQLLDPESPWEEKAEKGFILRQYLLEKN